MKTNLTLLPLCAAWLVLTPLPAASVSEQPRENAGSSPQESAHQETDATFDLSFPGGSFDELLDSLAEQTGRPPNAILGEQARRFSLPPFTLHSVTVDDVFQSLTDLVEGMAIDTGDRWRVAMQDPVWIFIYRPAEEEAEEPDDSAESEARSAESADATQARLRQAAEELRERRAVRARSGTQPASAPDAETPVTRIFQIGLLLERFPLDALTSAVETAWEVAGIGEGGRMQYHDETKLLFAHGTPRHVQFTEQVLDAMRNIPDPPELRAARARLQQLLQRGTDPVHPEVRETSERIERLEQEARQKFEAPGGGED